MDTSPPPAALEFYITCIFSLVQHRRYMYINHLKLFNVRKKCDKILSSLSEIFSVKRENIEKTYKAIKYGYNMMVTFQTILGLFVKLIS